MAKTEAIQALQESLEKATREIWVTEYRFLPPRRWRLDLACPVLRIGLEVQGGVWVNGKHARGDGLAKDHEKLNEGQLAGWVVLQCQPRQLQEPELAELLARAVAFQREQLADWLPNDTVVLAEDSRANGKAGEMADDVTRLTKEQWDQKHR